MEMSHFGWNNDGRSGGHQLENGDRECAFNQSCCFPRLASEGEKIYAVLDISNAEGKLLTRFLRGYTFEVSESGSEADEAETDYESDPDYEKREYPGHWDMTDIRFIGGDSGEIKDGDMVIDAERYGVEGEDMVCTFTGEDGSKQRIRIPDLRPERMYYANGFFYKELYLSHYLEPEDAGGMLECTVFLRDADIDVDEVSVTPEYYFVGLHSSDGGQKTFFAPPDEEKDTGSWYNKSTCTTNVVLDGSFPEGKTDGEKLYLVYEVSDGLSGNVKMYNIYEYTYSMDPDVVWDYNPPGV